MYQKRFFFLLNRDGTNSNSQKERKGTNDQRRIPGRDQDTWQRCPSIPQAAPLQKTQIEQLKHQKIKYKEKKRQNSAEESRENNEPKENSSLKGMICFIESEKEREREGILGFQIREKRRGLLTRDAWKTIYIIYIQNNGKVKHFITF